jgi:hypothetical protein
LRKALRVDLDLTAIPGAVEPKLRIYAIAEGGTLTERPIDGTIQDMFRNTAGAQLLILGEPGTGKTNLLLELADSLIEEAKSNQAFPIPVVFNLPRWTLVKEDRTLREWLKDDLFRQYGLSRATADALIRQDRILPLLDGLDEVSESRRSACANAITAFQKDRDLGRLAICCRVTEYATLPRLELATAVRVEKLTREDVEREIATPCMKRARQALESDPELLQLIDTPLWLHVLYAVSQAELAKRDTSVDPRDWLYAHYVEYTLGRETDDSPRRRTARGPMLRWLGWLAEEMRRHSQTQFAFEDLNESWIPSRLSRAVLFLLNLIFTTSTGLVLSLAGSMRLGMKIGLGLGLIFGLIFWHLGGGLAFGFFFGLAFGLSFMLYAAMAFGLLGGLILWLGGEESVELVEEFYLSWDDFVKRLIFGLVVGLAFGLGMRLGFLLAGGVSVGLFIGLGMGLVLGLNDGLRPQSVSTRSAPNLGTLRSSHYALGIVLSSVVLPSASFSIVRHLGPPASPSVRAILPLVTVFFGFTVAFLKGGFFALRHYVIRFLLWQVRAAPLQYVRFLNEANERLFLIRNGGSYEFLHVTFRDYMARVHGPNANFTPRTVS